MGKVTKFTGSRLLGAELKRLRGGRSLKQVAELSKTPPLSERVAPVAAPTLSQIENGISFPSVETLHSLAQIYKRPVQQWLDLVVQERLLIARPQLGEQEPSLESFTELGQQGDWTGALAVASLGEARASGPEALRWRVRRAQALHRIGFVEDAVTVLEACLDHPDLPDAQAFRLHQELASVLSRMGLHRSATLHQSAALAEAPADMPATARRHLLRGAAYSRLRLNESRERPDEREVRQSLRDLEAARALTDASDVESQSLIDIHAALARHLLGNDAVALRDLQSIARRARKEGREGVLLEALSALGAVRARKGDRPAAVAALEEAVQLAADAQRWGMAFDRCFDLYELTHDVDEGQAQVYLRRCERYYPLLQGRTARLVRFETVKRGA